MWDNKAAHYRELQTTTKVNITSIFPRLYKGNITNKISYVKPFTKMCFTIKDKLLLATTPRTCFYFDNTIDTIQGFTWKNKLNSHT